MSLTYADLIAQELINTKQVQATAALLVMIGALTNGQKVVLAVECRKRESKGERAGDDVR